MITEELYKRILSMYQETEEKYSYLKKDCGNCYLCCTAICKHYAIKEFELETIDMYIKLNNLPYSISKFKDYVARKHKPGHFEYLHKVCPFYDVEVHKCKIYPVRPLSCRMHGIFTRNFNSLFEECVYREFVKVIPATRIEGLEVSYIGAPREL